MIKDKVQKIIDEVYPKIEKHYGYSKFNPSLTPYIDLETSIYGRLAGEEDDGTTGYESPDGEYDNDENVIFIYYPKIKSIKHLIETLVHEYQHYLQSPIWMKRYYTMGYDYGNHPYEVQAYKEEKNWVLFK